MDKFTLLETEEKTVVHDALIFMLDTEDYSDRESIIIAELLKNLKDFK